MGPDRNAIAMQANPSAPFVHPLSLALPCPVMTIITGEWLQRRDRQRASRAIGGWKPPYRVSPRSSMRADCHMLLLARQSAFPLLHSSSILRWRTFFVVWVTETWRSVSWGEHKKSSGQKKVTEAISRPHYRNIRITLSRYCFLRVNHDILFLTSCYPSIYFSWYECIVCWNMATAHVLLLRTGVT